MNWTYILLALLAIIIAAYWYLKNIYGHWKKQNVPFVPNPIPLFGHMLPVIILKTHIIDFLDRAYKTFNSSSMVGFFFFQQPVVFLRDPELIRSVLQNNFSSFNMNFLSMSEDNDPIFARHPFFSSELNLWRTGRKVVSNNLTDNKLKYLSVVIKDVSEKMSAFIARKIEENHGYYECEFRTNFAKYTSEVVANAAFAIEGQNFEDNPDNLSFAKVAATTLDSSFSNALKQALLLYLPSIAKFFGLSFVSKTTDMYMRNNIKMILEHRQQADDAPNDYLKFCTEFNSDQNDIFTNIINFYLDVYSTTTIAIANTFHCLSENPEIQTKLRKHIVSVLMENGGTVDYDSIKNMHYLDQVIHEAIRRLPPVALQIKRCNEAISLAGSDGLTCHLKPGHSVFIPAYSVHLDEQYWPNPKLFDPDRFSLENRVNIQNYTFLGFGAGPRSCVGMKLGLLLMKHVIASLLLNFSIEPSTKTKVPLEIDPIMFLLTFKGGLWGQFKKL